MDNGHSPLEFIRKYETAIFVILAIIFSWVFWIPAAWINTGTLGFCLYYIGVLGPLVAAVELLILTRGWGGIACLLNGIFKWRVGAEWYVVALFLPLAIEFIVLFIVTISGTDLTFDSTLVANGSTFIGQAYFAAIMAIAFFGYLLPRLLKSYTPFLASLFLAVFFIAWDLPFVVSNITTGRANYEFWWAIGNLGAFFLFTWIYRNTRGSLLLLILFNLSLNYFRTFAKGLMQASPVGDLWSLDFSIHALAGIIILLACWKYFMGKSVDTIGSTEPTPDV